MTTQISSPSNNAVDNGSPFLTKFYAIQRCGSLESPVIFTNWNDCSYYVEQMNNDEGDDGRVNDDHDDVLYKEFDNIIDAVQFILPQNQPLMIPRTTLTSTPATTTTTTRTTVTRIRNITKRRIQALEGRNVKGREIPPQNLPARRENNHQSAYFPPSETMETIPRTAETMTPTGWTNAATTSAGGARRSFPMPRYPPHHYNDAPTFATFTAPPTQVQVPAPAPPHVPAAGTKPDSYISPPLHGTNDDYVLGIKAKDFYCIRSTWRSKLRLYEEFTKEFLPGQTHKRSNFADESEKMKYRLITGWRNKQASVLRTYIDNPQKFSKHDTLRMKAFQNFLIQLGFNPIMWCACKRTAPPRRKKSDGKKRKKNNDGHDESAEEEENSNDNVVDDDKDNDNNDKDDNIAINDNEIEDDNNDDNKNVKKDDKNNDDT